MTIRVRSAFLLFFMLLLACNGAQKELAIDPERPVFETQESNKLFFRNVRQAYYDTEEMPAANMLVCRIGERNATDAVPIIQAKIVMQWAADKAFVMLEPNNYLLGADTLHVVWADTANGASGTYIFPVASNQPGHFRFAALLYESILRGDELQIKGPSGALEPLFPTASSREPFRKTMVDFCRLVGLAD